MAKRKKEKEEEVDRKSDDDDDDDEKKEETKKKRKRTRRAKKKKRKQSEDKSNETKKEVKKKDDESDSDDEEKEEAAPKEDKNDIFAPRDVTYLPPPKKRKLSEEEKKGKRRKDLRRTIYVEGLPFTYNEEMVKEFFHKELEVEDDIIDIRLPRWQDSGRLRGYGHIVFNTIHIRDKALRTLNGKTIGNRYITIKEAHEPKNNDSNETDKRYSKIRAKPRTQPPNCRTIFIKNLPYEASERDIQDVFETYGKVVEEGGVRLARNSRTRQSKGFGYVQFKNMEAANAAVESSFKSSIVVGNRTVFVDYDDSGGKMKGSFRDEKGWLWKKKFG